MATKRIKFLKPWQMTPAGAEMELDTPVADLLINRKVAEEVKEAQMPVSRKAMKKALRKARANEGR